MCTPSGSSHFFLPRSFEYPKGTIPHQSGGGGGIIISARGREIGARKWASRHAVGASPAMV